MSSKLVQNFFKCDSMCSNVFKYAENLFKCVGFGCYKWLWVGIRWHWLFLGGDKWLWVHMGWNRLFFGVSSGYGFFWVVFGWLRLVLGGQKWLLAVMSGYQVFVFGSCLENAILTTSPPYKMSLPDKTSILTKHTFLTKRLLTFSQHKSWALKHGRKSVIQINHASGTSICLVNIISVFFQKNTGFKSNEIQL